jgi:translation initiation factor IF-1
MAEEGEKNTGGERGQADEVAGVVIEALPDTLFKVELASGEVILAYLSGRMRINHIRILIGDKVKLVLDSYGGKGRITRRL